MWVTYIFGCLILDTMDTPFDIIPEDLFRRFGFNRNHSDWLIDRRDFNDIFRDFFNMRDNLEKRFSEEFKSIESKIPKDLVREYETSDGSRVREVGPIVYGYSMNIGPDGKPHVRQFGNVKPSNIGFSPHPTLSAEREPLVQVDTTDKEVKIIAEMPGVSKEKIKIDAYDKYIEIKSEDPNRKYHKTIEVPEDIDIESGKSRYNNGILEVTFNKKEQIKKGKNINIE